MYKKVSRFFMKRFCIIKLLVSCISFTVCSRIGYSYGDFNDFININDECEYGMWELKFSEWWEAASKDSLLLPPALSLLAWLVYSLTLKMDAVCSSKISLDLYQTIWHHIQEDSTLHDGTLTISFPCFEFIMHDSPCIWYHHC